MSVDREQIRRDAEAVRSNLHGRWPTLLASHCLALLAELQQVERERDKWTEQALKVGADYAAQDLVSLDDYQRIQQLESRLAKVPPLVEAIQAVLDMDPPVIPIIDGKLAIQLRSALAAWEQQ